MPSIYGTSANDKLWFRGVNRDSDPAQNRVFGFSQVPKNLSNSPNESVNLSPTGGGSGGGIYVGGATSNSLFTDNSNFTDNSFYQGGSYSVGGVTQNYDFSIGAISLSSDNSMLNNFDIQQDFTSFMFNPTYNNMYTINQYIINQNNDTGGEGGGNGSGGGSSGGGGFGGGFGGGYGGGGGIYGIATFTGTVRVVKDVKYDDEDCSLTITYTNMTFNNGMLATSSGNDETILYLDKLKTLYDWYELGLTDPSYVIGTNVQIEDNSLVQTYNQHNINHGLIVTAGPIEPFGVISTLTDCPP